MMSTMQKGNDLSQFQQVLKQVGVSRQYKQTTSRRKWQCPRQQQRYQAWCIKSGNFMVQNILKKHVLKYQSSKQRNFFTYSQMENYFRYWKKRTNIESRRYKIQHLKEIYARLQQNIRSQKL
jgi:hypothetical protein